MATSRKQNQDQAKSLTQSARGVFRQLVVSGSATRPQLAEQLNLSRPTLSLAIEDLEALCYVEPFGMTQNASGRRATMYRLASGAGHVIAVDAGSTHVRIRVQSIAGDILYNGVYGLIEEQRRMTVHIAEIVEQAVRETRAAAQPFWGPLRCMGVALPTKVSDKEALFPDRENELMHRIEKLIDVPVVFENNVNCAAIAEGFCGNAVDEPFFVYIQIGIKIGMGIVLDGQLLRGRNGAAGEVSYLPFPWAPNQNARREELEAYLGSEAMMVRVRNDWPKASESSDKPEKPRELFEMAEAGHPLAKHYVTAYAKEIGQLVAASIAVLDPGLVVLGGGIGQNKMLLPDVCQVVNELHGETQVETTALGEDATLIGIARMATSHAQSILTGEISVGRSTDQSA